MDDFSLGGFKMDDYGQGESFHFLPGEYRAVISKCFTDKLDTNGWVGIIWVVSDGSAKGEEFFQFLQLSTNPDRDTSEAAIKFNRDKLADTFRAIGFPKPPADWSEIVGRCAVLHLETNTYKGRDSTQLAHIEPDPRGNKSQSSAPPPTTDEDFDDEVPF